MTFDTHIIYASYRLRSSTVLVVGLRGLGSEVVKNIVLAGVKGVTILDHVPLSREDVAGRFLMQQEGGNVSHNVSNCEHIVTCFILLSLEYCMCSSFSLFPPSTEG